MHGFWAHQNILFFVGRRRYNNQLLLCVDLDLSRAEEIFQTVNDLGGSDDGTEVYHNLLGFCCVLFFLKKKNTLHLDVKGGNTRWKAYIDLKIFQYRLLMLLQLQSTHSDFTNKNVFFFLVLTHVLIWHESWNVLNDLFLYESTGCFFFPFVEFFVFRFFLFLSGEILRLYRIQVHFFQDLPTIVSRIFKWNIRFLFFLFFLFFRFVVFFSLCLHVRSRSRSTGHSFNTSCLRWFFTLFYFCFSREETGEFFRETHSPLSSPSCERKALPRPFSSLSFSQKKKTTLRS